MSQKLTGKLALAFGESIKRGKLGPIVLKNKVVLVIEEYLEHVKAIYVNDEDKLKTIRLKRIDLYPIKNLYPHSLFIKEPGVKLDGQVEVPDNTQTCSYYARRGSHWVEYHIGPASQDYYIDQDDLPEHIDSNFYDTGNSAEEIVLLRLHYSLMQKSNKI